MRIDAYTLLVALHLLAMVLWIGHMLFWSLVVGPLCKRADPPADGETLRAAAALHAGLGWPALATLGATGLALLYERGMLSSDGLAALTSTAGGRAFAGKLVLVAAMVLYQWRVGHRPAPKLIYLNIAAALAIVALSVLFVRHEGFLLLPGPPPGPPMGQR
jgi:uncharacterized membrane protein